MLTPAGRGLIVDPPDGKLPALPWAKAEQQSRASPERGYDDPTQHYARYEQVDGVHVLRVPWSSFGKRSLPVRLIGGGDDAGLYCAVCEPSS